MSKSPPIQQPQPSTINKALTTAKELLPFLLLVSQMIFGFGLKQASSDRMQEQVQEDRLALQQLRSDVNKLEQQQAVAAKEIDLLVGGDLHSNRHDQ